MIEAADMLQLRDAWLDIPELGSQPLPLRPVQPSACTAACPAGIHVKSYVSLIAEERFVEALQVVREHCPLPGVCGRVCTHPCELACERGSVDQPIAIRALKRFVADRELELERVDPYTAPVHGARVAIIGSGPAGLTAAWDLRRAGHPVTIFEAETEPGGMLKHGIADYRLPPDVLRHEIDFILRSGIELRIGARLGQDLELQALLEGEFGAVLLATGAQIGRRLGLDQETRVDGVEDALAFLRRVNAGSRERLSGPTLVIGGGSTAIEAARAALRLGAPSVKILYRRDEVQMPCSSEEVQAARSEGVEIEFLVTPVRLVSSGDALDGLVCRRSKLGAPDASGRPRPLPIAGSEFVVKGRYVLAAIGQDVDLSFLPARGREALTDGHRLHVARESGATRLSGVFAAGDLVTGGSTVIEAIATGHRAAASVRRYLNSAQKDTEAWDRWLRAGPSYELPEANPPRASRIDPIEQAIDPKTKFAEVEQVFSHADAVAEARRCLRCGPCDECRVCVPSCRRRHIALRVDGADSEHAVLRAPLDLALSLPDDRPVRGRLTTGSGKEARSRAVEAMPLRARVLAPECRGCENCAAACSFDAIQFLEGGNGNRAARIDPSRCRGCNLCTAVCPTAAARATVLYSSNWDRPPLPWGPIEPRAGSSCVVVCDHRAGELAPQLPDPGRGFELLRVRCLGQLDEGTLLDAFLRGFQRVIIGGCEQDHCRYLRGSAHAAEIVDRSRLFLQAMGRDPVALTMVSAVQLPILCPREGVSA